MADPVKVAKEVSTVEPVTIVEVLMVELVTIVGLI